MLRCWLSLATQWVLLTCLFSLANAQEPRSQSNQTSPASPLLPATGLLTSRLSPKEIVRWRAIEQIVFAEDSKRQPRHPTLRSLWEWVETSGHAIFIEFVRSNQPSTTSTAGHFHVEKLDPRGERHVAIIKLNLTKIDQAYIGPRAVRAGNFIPFTGLSREERYAEVLGHELAHAVHILTELERTRIVEQEVQQTNELLLSQHAGHTGGVLAPDLEHRITRRDLLLKALEEQAENVEKVVWEELFRSKLSKDKLPYALTQR